MPPVIAHAPLETPIGRLWVAISPRGLVSITRGDLPESASPRLDPPAVAFAIAELEAYFEGRLRNFSIPLDLRGARAFDSAVWTAAREIPYGETVSYSELAGMAGHPGAAPSAARWLAARSSRWCRVIGSSTPTARSAAGAATSGSSAGFWTWSTPGPRPCRDLIAHYPGSCSCTE